MNDTDPKTRPDWNAGQVSGPYAVSNPPAADDTIRTSAELAGIFPPLQAPPPLDAELVEPSPIRRRRLLPVLLFVASCASTFWVGTTFLAPDAVKLEAAKSSAHALAEAMRDNPELAKNPSEQASIRDQARYLYLFEHNYRTGLTYMCAVIGILLCHEMGHFLQTVRHRIPASLPYFIPMPFGPIGTMGAVIGMNGLKANRRELFDIGITGPLAGLVIAVPLLWLGVVNAEVVSTEPVVGHFERESGIVFHNPWLVEIMIEHLRPDIGPDQDVALNPFVLAGWVGMLITGLNMMPVSQLDGGHVVYALFGPQLAHRIAKGFVVVAILFIVSSGITMWVMMLILVILIGPEHPPTSDDSVELSPMQRLIGFASLSIPFLCFPPGGIEIK